MINTSAMLINPNKDRELILKLHQIPSKNKLVHAKTMHNYKS